MAAIRVLLCLLALTVAGALAADDGYEQTLSLNLVNGTYSSYPNVGIEETPAELSGVVTVSLVKPIEVSTTICFSALPIFTSNITSACPSSGLVFLSNETAAVEIKVARKSFSAFSSTKRLSGNFARSLEAAAPQTVTLLANTAYYVYASAAGSATQEVDIKLTAALCPEGEIGSPCVAATPITVGDPAPFQVQPASYLYYAVNPADFDATVGAVSFAILPDAPAVAAADAPANLVLLAQVGALPVAGSSANVITAADGSITVENPASLRGTLYVGVQNAGTTAAGGQLNATNTICAANSFGVNCSPTTTIQLVSAAIGTQLTGKKADGFVTYQIDSTTIPADAQVVRASVSSSSSPTANPIYAKLGSVPTITSYDYTTSNAYVNQLVLPVTTGPAAADTFNATAWYVSVSATADYVFWVGANCYGSCNSWSTTSTNGKCECNGQACNGTTTYQIPTAADSFGVCDCKDTKKQNNYDCSALVEKSSPFKTIYIVLIAVGGAIVLAVAIGVPVYCYLQNRKRDYERL